MTAHQDLSMFRGESMSQDLYFTNVDGSAKDLTSVLVEWLVETYDDASTVVLTRSTPASGIVKDPDQVSSGHKGHATLTLVPGDTSALPVTSASRSYSHKARTTDADGFVSVGVHGLFTLRHE